MSKTNTFQTSVLKHMVRQLLINKITDHFGVNNPLKCYTLPGDSLAFEEALYDIYKTRVKLEGVERDRLIFDRATSLIASKGLPMVLHKSDDTDFWSSTCDTWFNMIWLDYCSGWNQFQRSSLEHILTGEHLSFSRKNPLLAITVCDGYEFNRVEELELSVIDLLKSSKRSESKDRGRLVGIPRLLNKVANANRYSLVPQFIIRYRDAVRDKRAVPMFIFMFEVLRGKKTFNEKNIPVVNMVADYSAAISLH